MTEPDSEAGRANARLGSVLRGKYRLDRVLGMGGMATVYAATHRNGMEMAVKVLHAELTARPDIRARFVREGMAANALRHPGAVKVVDDDVAEDGSAFLVMELLQGEPLDAVWERCAHVLQVGAVLAIGFQLCDVLAVAHRAGVIHRDLKPQNLFLTLTGQLKVLDFGIAQLRAASAEMSATSATDTGMMLGTPTYMSPEQAGGETRNVSALSDVYGVGATLFTLVSGAHVHEGESAQQIVIRTATRPARSLASVAPEAPQALVDIVDRALAFDPASRWSSALEMRDALRSAHLSILGVPMPATIPLPRLTGLAWFRHTSSPPSADLSTAVPVALGRGRRSTDASATPSVTAPAALDAPEPAAAPSPVAPGVPRVRKRVYVLASAVLAVALALAAFVGLRTGGSRHASGSPPAPGASSVSELPVSPVAAAEVAYRAGIQAEHDANRDVAETSYLAAAAADPGMGRAHLRYAILVFLHEHGGEAHSHFLKATGLRSTLREPEAALLDAYAPLFEKQPPDWSEAERRLDAASKRWPTDTKLLRELAVVQLQRNELGAAVATADAALAVDPRFAGGFLIKEIALQQRGDNAGVEVAAAACLEAAPQAAACLGLRAEAAAADGRCKDVERDALQLISINPEGPGGFSALAQAGLARGRSLAGVLEPLKASWKNQGDGAPWAEVSDRASLAVLFGDGPDLKLRLDAMEKAADEGRDAFEHMNSAWLHVEASTELGDLPRAATAASAFLDRRDAWQSDPGLDMQSISVDVVPMMTRAMQRGGMISEAELAGRRDAWLAAWRERVTPTVASYLWIYGYAMNVGTRAQALEALAALPPFSPLPPYRPSFIADAAIGYTYLLAGQPDIAAPLLEHASTRCDPFEDPFAYVHASLWLGEARQLQGKKDDACAAYGRVVRTFHGLGPRSVTLREARARATELGCSDVK